MLRGAFIDSKGVRWDPNDADFEGFLFKKSKWLKERRKRFFILKGLKLFFSKDSKTTPHGLIDLVDCISISIGTNKSSMEFTMQTIGGSGSESFQLSADSEREITEWVTIIRKALAKHQTMHVGELDEEETSLESR